MDASRDLVVVKVCCSGDFSAVEFGDSETLNICYGEGRVVRDGTREDLPDLLLDPPEVGGLAHESGAADLGHSWKEVAVVVAEVVVGPGFSTPFITCKSG